MRTLQRRRTVGNKAGSTGPRIPTSSTVQDGSETLPAFADRDNPVCGSVDRAFIQKGALGETYLHISGWLYYIYERPVILQLGTPGSSFVIAHRHTRSDLAAGYPAFSGIAESGFEVRLPLDVDQPQDTPVLIYFLATLSDGLALSGCFPLPPLQEIEAAPSVQTTASPNLLARTQQTLLRAFFQSQERICFRPKDSAPISIIIPLHNKAELTLSCLQALAATEAKEFQVVLVDNASTDETAELLKRVDGATTIRLGTNRHFIEACNRGADAASGPNLLFLNNDTIVTPGSIDAALRCLREEPHSGAVGGRLIRLDGTLQEAGSIVWNDGSTNGYGTGDDPWRPLYSFRRDVDYCSAAFLLTPAELFRETGKFSREYAPAYYEDVDYCLRLRRLGYRVLYEPGAVILHAEHASSSAEDAVSLQLKNRAKLIAAHSDYLLQRPSASPENMLAARSAPSDKPRILYIEDRVPSAGLGSGFPRSLQLIEAFVEIGSEVTLFPTLPLQETFEEIYRHLPRNVEVVSDYSVEQLEKFLEERSEFYDAVVISRPHNMERFAEIAEKRQQSGAKIKVIYDAEAVYAVRDILKLMVQDEITLPPEDMKKIVSTETNLAKDADYVLTVSESEADYFRSISNSRIKVVSYGAVCDPGLHSFEFRKHFLTVGPVYDQDSPNADANLWFVNEILPVLSKLLGSHVYFDIAGLIRYAPIHRLQDGNVRLLGEVENLKALTNRYRVFVAPTRFAAGIPLKVISAARYGLPVVGTPLIASQLGWTDGKELLVGRTAEEFADKCAQLYSSPELWERIRANALEAVARDFSPEEFRNALSSILRER